VGKALRHQIGDRHWKQARLWIGKALADGSCLTLDLAGNLVQATLQKAPVLIVLLALIQG
jgi:hypothetical protein